VVLLAGCVVLRAHADGELSHYVARTDATYTWREMGAGHLGNVDYVEIILTSQTWRDIPWKHQLFVFRPAKTDAASRQALLFIDGGRWKPEYETAPYAEPREARLFTRLATSIRAPVAVLRQVPFQPLFERKEDALIAYTFDSYLRTGDPDWPLLFPMVKSAVRGMDAVQELTRRRWQISIEHFMVTGASKRGWTSWLTAAVDPRVASVAPMVIDMLNMPAQIDLQRATFGDLSEQVRDYSDIGLPARIDSDLGRQLVAMVDPYSYRESLDQSKLIVLGTNDPYWPLDALKLYWSDLHEPKRVLYLPNQGHGLKDADRVIGSLSALFRYSARGQALPELSWSWRMPEANGLELLVQPDRRPRQLHAWIASSPTRDFREAHWSQQHCEGSATGFTCRERLARDHYSALYAEAAFKDRGEEPFSLSTAVCIAGGPEDARPDCLTFQAQPQHAASARVSH
jgi:PhoPQ-activated pathogenicity-related protein